MSIGWIAELFLYKEELLSGEKARIRVWKAYIVAFVIIFIGVLVYISFISPMQKQHATHNKLRTISYYLLLEKERTNTFPDEILTIARRNLIDGDLTVDSWNNEILYQKTVNGEDYTLTSKGADGVLDTEDDIVIHKLLE
ncbi:hypothetical protein [Kordia sp.]|uniref:hypothetical protein n=1 Tax=Kordia sp. TaxID=1965332 RepID=UPI003D2C824E